MYKTMTEMFSFCEAAQQRKLAPERQQSFPAASAQPDTTMTTTQHNGPEDNRDHSNRLVRAKTYKHGWNNDLQALSKFVKEQVFYVVVHDFKNESDDPLDVNRGAICQNLYLKRFPSKVTNVHMKKATKEEMMVYLKDLWTTALNTKGRGNIRRELSSEKSAVYAVLNEAFRSKYYVPIVVCLYSLCFTNTCWKN